MAGLSSLSPSHAMRTLERLEDAVTTCLRWLLVIAFFAFPPFLAFVVWWTACSCAATNRYYDAVIEHLDRIHPPH